MKKDNLSTFLIYFISILIAVYSLFMFSDIFDKGLFVITLSLLLFIALIILFYFSKFSKKSYKNLKIQSDFWYFFVIIVAILYLVTVLFVVVF